MNIVILTGRFGMGHFSAAQAILSQLEREMPDAKAEVIDFIEYATDSEWIYKAFSLVVRRADKVFNQFYHLSENGVAGLPMKRFLFQAFSRMLAEKKPDLIISTLPLTTQLVGQYKAKYHIDIPMVACVTDTTIHGDWVTGGADAYMAPCAEAKAGLATYGIDPSRIFVTGVPVRPGFFPARRQAASDTRNLLVLGGGLGMICDDADFYAALNDMPNVKTTVICGSNQRLHSQLEGRYPNIEALGFVDNVEDYMRQADLLVSKPGGSTLYEAIACRLPILSLRPLLAQEKANASFIQRHGLGRVLEGKPEKSVDYIRHMLWDEKALAAARENMESQAGQVSAGALTYLIRVLTAQSCVA